MIIFPNKRAVRNYLNSLKLIQAKKNIKTFSLEPIITISEFEEKAIIIKNGLSLPNSILRELIFHSVVQSLKIEKTLNIDTNIFHFLSFSRYFFSFFQELSYEDKFDSEENIIDEVLKADYYEDFKEHILILKDIQERYKTKLHSLGLTDKIFIPKDFEINSVYIKSLGEIKLLLSGRLSNFQIRLFEKISEIIPVKIEMTKSRFYPQINQQLNLELKNNRRYLIDFNNKKILSEKVVGVGTNWIIESFKYRLTQIGFIKERIFFYHEKLNIPLENIAVILLDERFAEEIKEFCRNLNFAMGKPNNDWKVFRFFKLLQTQIETLNQNQAKGLEKFFEEEEQLKTIFNFFNDNWFREVEIDTFLEMIINAISLLNEKNNKVLNRVLKILKLFQELKEQNITKFELRSLFILFMQELKKIRLDDLKGGKVTALGLLETREVYLFDAVIIIDFNDEVFPKKEEKDLFINNDIRRKVGLPTIQDRENLQKLYLEALLQNVKYFSISFVDNEKNRISRFFYDFDFKISPYNREYELELLTKTIFGKKQEIKNWSFVNSKELEIDNFQLQNKALSNSQINTLLNCPRKYLLKNVLKIYEHQTEFKPNLALGQVLHLILEKIYRNKKFYYSKFDILEAIEQEFFSDEVVKNFKIPKIYFSFWLEKLNKFAIQEIKRFSSGITVLELEKSLTVKNYNGFELTGKIDRIDKNSNGDLIVIDYKLTKPNKIELFSEWQTLFKSKTIPDFQLVIYYILLKKSGYKVNLKNFYYYILSTGELIQNRSTVEEFDLFLKTIQKLSLEDIIKMQLDLNIDDCNNQFCPYFKTLCLK